MHDFALASNILADRHFLLHEQMTMSHLGKKISFGQEQEVGTSPLPFPFGDLRGAVALRQIAHVHRGLLLAARMNAPARVTTVNPPRKPPLFNMSPFLDRDLSAQLISGGRKSSSKSRL